MTELKKVCFHHNDQDGLCSGALVYTYFREQDIEIEMRGIDYEDQFPWNELDPNSEIWMVDFCLQPFSEMIRLANTFAKVIWIDHHIGNLREEIKYRKRFQETITKLKGHRFSNVAACILTHDYINEDDLISRLPKAVNFISLWDTWKWKDHPEKERIELFHYGMEAQDLDPTSEIWNRVMEFDNRSQNVFIDEIAKTGILVKRYQEKKNYELAKKIAFLLEFEGMKFLAANRGSGSSFFKGVIEKYPDIEAMLVFLWKGNKYRIRMYTENKDLDLSLIAKKYGGSGHAGACGFTCDELPFELKGNV
jgi:oligoribonuclease NrnB/cAMP/cGMP phosphodiesterase (DHH superfamily)